MRNRTGLVAVVCSLAVALTAGAGSLTPPVGPVAVTHKTLTEVEPRTPVQSLAGDATANHIISQPGSYYLTGNILGVSGKDGIRIAASGVEVDLNGFELVGVAGTTNGITTLGANRVTVRGGEVRNWGGWGLFMGGEQHRVSGLRVSGCAFGLLTGHLGRLEDCLLNANGTGAQVGDGCIVVRCIATNNGGTGINVDGGSLVDGCVATGNSGIGINQSSGTGAIISNNTVKQNGINGIDVCSGCLIENNVCLSNGTATATGAGINSRCGGNRIEGNLCHSNDRAIALVANTKEVVVRNSMQGNAATIVNQAGNDIGPIGTAAAATSPWANISN